MKKLITLAALVLAGFAGTARATTLDFKATGCTVSIRAQHAQYIWIGLPQDIVMLHALCETIAYAPGINATMRAGVHVLPHYVERCELKWSGLSYAELTIITPPRTREGALLCAKFLRQPGMTRFTP